jgi:hypothetical protein
LTTQCVSYSRSNTTSLALHIPLEAATNREAVAEYKEREAKRQRLKEEQVGVAVAGWGLLVYLFAQLQPCTSNPDRVRI